MHIGVILVFLLLLTLAAAAAFVWLVFRAEKNYRDMVGDVQNFDAFLRDFYYYVDRSPQEVMRALSVPGTYEAYSYHYDRESGMLNVSHALMGNKLSCLVILREQGSGTLLHVYRREGNVPGRKLLYFMNPFWAAVLNAVPVLYTSYHKNQGAK